MGTSPCRTHDLTQDFVGAEACERALDHCVSVVLDSLCSMGNYDDKSRDYDRRAGQALVAFYNLAKAGGGHAGEAVAPAYRDLLDAAESTFRAGIEAGDLEQAKAGWNELVDVAANIAHANARVGTVLLATAVNHLEEPPEELIAKVMVEVEKNSS